MNWVVCISLILTALPKRKKISISRIWVHTYYLMFVGLHDNLFIIHLYIYIYFIYIYICLYIHYIYLCDNVLSMYVVTYKMRMNIMSFFMDLFCWYTRYIPYYCLEVVLLQKKLSFDLYPHFTSIYKESRVREKEKIICNAHNPACSIYFSLSIFLFLSLFLSL